VGTTKDFFISYTVGSITNASDPLNAREGGVPLLVEKWANAGSGTDAMRRQ
jgi:hypothetical protein